LIFLENGVQFIKLILKMALVMFERLIQLSQKQSAFLFGARGVGKTTLLKALPWLQDALMINLLVAKTENQFARNPDALFEKRKPFVDKTITELSDKFKLSDDERTALLNKCYLGLDSDPAPEVIAQSALAIMADKDKFTKSVTNNALGIFLLEKALEIASTCTEKDYVPKRFALVLAEIYSNSRDGLIDKVPFNEKLALKYLTLAKEHGSNTATGLLEEENPIKALCESQGVDYNSIKASSGCLARSNDTLFSTSTDGMKDERLSSGLDDDVGLR